MSLRQLSRAQLTDEILIIILTTMIHDRRVRLLAGVMAIALVVAHRRDLIRAVVASTLSVVEAQCERLPGAPEESCWHQQ